MDCLTTQWENWEFHQLGSCELYWNQTGNFATISQNWFKIELNFRIGLQMRPQTCPRIISLPDIFFHDQDQAQCQAMLGTTDTNITSYINKCKTLVVTKNKWERSKKCCVDRRANFNCKLYSTHFIWRSSCVYLFGKFIHISEYLLKYAMPVVLRYRIMCSFFSEMMISLFPSVIF